MLIRLHLVVSSFVSVERTSSTRPTSTSTIGLIRSTRISPRVSPLRKEVSPIFLSRTARYASLHQLLRSAPTDPTFSPPNSPTTCFVGALPRRCQVPRYAANEAVPRYGPALGRRTNRRRSRFALCDPQVSFSCPTLPHMPTLSLLLSADSRVICFIASSFIAINLLRSLFLMRSTLLSTTVGSFFYPLHSLYALTTSSAASSSSPSTANVARVARYLREHSSEQFQFIVISLKEFVPPPLSSFRPTPSQHSKTSSI
jgi:hypothetical protein